MPAAAETPLQGWRQTCHLKLRFGLSKLPVCPVRYRLRTPGLPDVFFRWTRVMPFMDPVKGAFDFDLWGWDVRELRFLRRFLRPGMTVVDIGAHYGLYAVLAAQLVGPTGHVLAVEPAPAVCRRLRWHLRLNGARHTEALQLALGATRTKAVLFLPHSGIDTIGGLRPAQSTSVAMDRVEVPVEALDAVLAAHRFRPPDLIKLDVEGGEPEVLDGAAQTLATGRTLWLFEALDDAAAAWGRSARLLVDRFRSLGHTLYEFAPDGWLVPHAVLECYGATSNCNLLAVPPARVASVAPLVRTRSTPTLPVA